MRQEEHLLARLAGEAVADGRLIEGHQLRVTGEDPIEDPVPEIGPRVWVEVDGSELRHQQLGIMRL